MKEMNNKEGGKFSIMSIGSFGIVILLGMLLFGDWIKIDFKSHLKVCLWL